MKLIESQILNMFSDCPMPFYAGDGYCDDLNNIDSCNFDGGDCCLEIVITDYCTECICYEGTSVNTTTSITTTITSIVITSNYKYQKYKLRF